MPSEKINHINPSWNRVRSPPVRMICEGKKGKERAMRRRMLRWDRQGSVWLKEKVCLLRAYTLGCVASWARGPACCWTPVGTSVVRLPSRELNKWAKARVFLWAHPLPGQSVLNLHWCFGGSRGEWAGSDCECQPLLGFAAQSLMLGFRYFPTLFAFQFAPWREFVLNLPW